METAKCSRKKKQNKQMIQAEIQISIGTKEFRGSGERSLVGAGSSRINKMSSPGGQWELVTALRLYRILKEATVRTYLNALQR